MKKSATFFIVVILIILLLFLFSKRSSKPEVQQPVVPAATDTSALNEGIQNVESGLTEAEEAAEDIDTSDLENLDEDLNVEIP